MTAGSSVENWALVVGIDKYWSDGAALHGAVRDALRMREWLLDGAGGGVPAEHLVLALAPRDDERPDLPFVEATKDRIMIAINDLLSMSGGKGERLFFFYAGHGLTARVDNRDENALVASDFNAVNTDNSIALRSLCSSRRPSSATSSSSSTPAETSRGRTGNSRSGAGRFRGREIRGSIPSSSSSSTRRHRG